MQRLIFFSQETPIARFLVTKWPDRTTRNPGNLLCGPCIPFITEGGPQAILNATGAMILNGVLLRLSLLTGGFCDTSLKVLLKRSVHKRHGA